MPMLRSAGSKERHLAQIIRSLLEASFANRSAIENIAVKLEISARHIRAVLKRHYGYTPSRFIILLRLENAKRLLATGHPIKQAAVESGFFDQAHLARHFKRVMAVTPAEYVKSAGALASGNRPASNDWAKTKC